MRIPTILLLTPLILQASPKPHDPTKPDRVIFHGDPSSGKIALQTPAPNITSAYFTDDPQRQALQTSFNPTATEVTLEVPEALRSQKGSITFETTDHSVAYPDGRIIFSALDARVEGPKKAKLETHPGNHRIGFWRKIEDSVIWDFSPTTCGMYYVDLTYSLSGKKSDIQITLADQSLKATIRDTGSYYRYTTVPLGKIYLQHDKPTTLSVKALKKYAGAVMNLKAVTLRPAPEGETPVARPDALGKVTLMAGESTVYGIKLRYEITPKKLCIGDWTMPDDYVIWDFEIPADGRYQATIYQGCDDENSGSPVRLSIGNDHHDFTVKSTGHFQNFQPVVIGTYLLSKGRHHVQLRAQGKTKVSVMDVKKIILTPLQ